jgi:5'-nucleotidase
MFPQNPRILCTNDDGADAHGLQVLERIAAQLSDDVWTVAPAVEQSGASRALSLNDPLRVRKLGERRWSVSGTPTDCVMLAMGALLGDRAPDLILSGVNRGQNLAEHVTYSGTVAGAMQGMELGVPSIALSQAYDFGPESHIHWDTAETHAPEILRALMSAGWPQGVLININFPDVAPDAVQGVEITRLGQRNEQLMNMQRRLDPGGREYYWLGFHGRGQQPPEGVDIRAVQEGRISVTPLHVDLTHDETRRHLAQAFSPSPPH